MRGGRPAILILDDEQYVVESLQRTLRHDNWEVVIETSPVRATEILAAGGIDIIISDIDMPEMSGLEFIALARQHHPEVVRILLTGDASMQSALRAINDGAVHKYLTKPWSSHELRELLRDTVLRLDAFRQEAMGERAAAATVSRRQECEARYPGIGAVSRIDGAYLLNEARVVESLRALDRKATPFAALRWLPIGDDATMDIKNP